MTSKINNINDEYIKDDENDIDWNKSYYDHLKKKRKKNNSNKRIKKRKTICKAATVGVSECIGSASNKGITRDFTKGY